MSSLLSLHVKRLGEVLRFGAEEQVDESKTKLESASDLYDDFLSELIVTEFDYGRAYDVANRLFGSARVKFAAVDGSQDQRLVLRWILRHRLGEFQGRAFSSICIDHMRLLSILVCVLDPMDDKFGIDLGSLLSRLVPDRSDPAFRKLDAIRTKLVEMLLED